MIKHMQATRSDYVNASMAYTSKNTQDIDPDIRQFLLLQLRKL